MRINTKIMMLTAMMLLVTSLSIGAVSIWQLRRNGDSAIAGIEKLGIEEITKIKAEELAYRQDLLAAKQEYLKSQVQTAVCVLEKVYEDARVEKPEKPDNIQQKALEMIKALRYGPENKDYFWINDMHHKMVMHPYTPELEGKDCTEHKDPKGKRLFIEFVNACREKGEGFVDYDWPKYGADKPQPKLSYVRLFKQWNWVIGTGIYIDDIEQKVLQRKQELQKALQTAAAKMQREIEAIKSQIKEDIGKVFILIGAITLVLLAVMQTAAFVASKRLISNPITQILYRLNEGAEQVASASKQISASGRLLSEGASKQAASIEETSSSLEEMSAMTKQNAQNANEADHLMKEANTVVKNANASMSDLASSMNEITRASEETSKIIKTIDEIAFQTNLLALNAAVEAARAGEAGAGFAVVADEVRNLAMRAADAAKNTAGMIDATIKKVGDGSEMMNKADEAFSQVAEKASKVGELLAEIAAASNEQAQGIEQLNMAVSEMDRVTQQNAATAEESAGASVEMNNQSRSLSRVVDDLMSMVGGSRKEVPSERDAVSIGETRGTGLEGADGRKMQGIKPAVHNAVEMRPNQVIPMDEEEDFEDF